MPGENVRPTSVAVAMPAGFGFGLTRAGTGMDKNAAGSHDRVDDTVIFPPSKSF